MVPIIGVGAFSLVIPITLGDPPGDVLRDVLIPAGHRRVHADRRLVRRGARQFRPQGGAGCGGRAADRLHGDGRSADVGGDSGAHLRISGARRLTRCQITVGVTLLMLFANLRGIREAGAFFAIPTYFYIASLSFVVVTGLIKAALGALNAHPLPSAHDLGYPVGQPGQRVADGAGHLLLSQGLRQRRRVAHRTRSRVRRDLEFSSSGGAQRSQGPCDDVPDPWFPGARHVDPRAPDPRRPL